MRVSDLRPSPLNFEDKTISLIEHGREAPSPAVSAGPVIREKEDALATEGANTFGIKL